VQGLYPANTLQQLLDACPHPAARRSVWRIAEHLPCLTAANQLRTYTLRRIADGSLLAAAANGGSAGADAAAVADAEQRDELRSILACLAAAPCSAKLAALLAAALGLPWGPEDAVASTVAAAGPVGGEESAGSDEEGDEEEIACKTCGKAKPDHNLLLCDGCDLAYHTTCLKPKLKMVPEGEWFCPGCDMDIRASRLSVEGALE